MSVAWYLALAGVLLVLVLLVDILLAGPTSRWLTRLRAHRAEPTKPA